MDKTVEQAKDAIILRVKGAIGTHNLRDPLTVWWELSKLLRTLEERKAEEGRQTSYRCVGGPRDGDYIALQSDRYDLHVVTNIGKPFFYKDSAFPPPMPDYETVTYTVRRNRKTGERALVFEGLEGWE